jgi:alpha 1,2-mannosyltransferase
MIKAAIFILTQNTIERKVYLKTSLYFLFKNFNAKYKYPVIILHEGDYTEDAKNDIIAGIRSECRSLLTFKQIDEEDFTIPSHIDKEKMDSIIDLRIVPYWRNQKYRSMCNFWLKNFSKYTTDYEYVMRIDDDSIIEEPIKYDLFELMRDKDYIYLSNIIHLDCSLCNYGMKDFFVKYYQDQVNQDNQVNQTKLDKINELFMDHKLTNDNGYFNNFKKLYKSLHDKEYTDETVELSMPFMYYNNFNIISVDTWNKPEIQDIVKKIDEQGYIYYCRWGDAPLQTIILSLYDSNRITKVNFKYSKRLQRESFKDDDGALHSFMPNDYENNSCVLKNSKK